MVDSHLSKLRQKLVSAGCANMIEPVRGVGYRL
ncbi:winged helix-turn-helix domain-containing protein [Sphingomonas sp. R86520]